MGDKKIQVGTDLRIGKKESSRRLTFLFLHMDHFYCIAQGKKKKSLFQVPKAKEKWLMDHPFERRAGEDRWVISDKKKKKTGDQIWNEEQHSRVEFMLVMKFDR